MKQGLIQLENIVNIWKELAKNVFLRIDLNGSLDNVEECYRRIKTLGDTVGIKSYATTYVSGVPIEDIFC